MTLWPRPSQPTQHAVAAQANAQLVRPTDSCHKWLDTLDRTGLGALYTAALAEPVRWPRLRLGACASSALGILAAGETRRLLVDRYTKGFAAPLHRTWDGVEAQVARGCAKLWRGQPPASATPDLPVATASSAPPTTPLATLPRAPRWVGASVVALPRAVTEVSALAYLGLSESAAVVVGVTAGVVFGLLVATPVGVRLSADHMRWVNEVLSVLRRTREILSREAHASTEPHQAALVVLAAAMLTQLAQHVSSGTGQALLNHVATLLAPIAPLPPRKLTPPPPTRSLAKGARRLLSVIAEDDELRSDKETSLDGALTRWMQIVEQGGASEPEIEEALGDIREALARQPASASASPTHASSIAVQASTSARPRSMVPRSRGEARPLLSRTTSLPHARSL